MFKLFHILYMYRLYVAEYIDNYGNGNGSLGCGYTYSEHCEEESLKMLGVAVGVEHGKIYIHCIQHKLGAYEKRDKVAPREKSEYSDEKEYCGECKVKLCRYYHSFLFFSYFLRAIIMAPTIQAKSRMLSTSNVST